MSLRGTHTCTPQLIVNEWDKKQKAWLPQNKTQSSAHATNFDFEPIMLTYFFEKPCKVKLVVQDTSS